MKYNLKIINENNRDWFFCVYHKMPEEQQNKANTFSLAWLVSKYPVSKGNFVHRHWSVDYHFVWGETGRLEPGVNINDIAGGAMKTVDQSASNKTTFGLDPGPKLSDPESVDPPGSLIVKADHTVPPHTFSVGIGMDDSGIFIQQAEPSIHHFFTPTHVPEYYVAADTSIKVGDVSIYRFCQLLQYWSSSH